MSGLSQVFLLMGSIVVGALGFLFAQQTDVFKEVDESGIYGEWVEQEVAPYAADRFEIRKDGIYINGRRSTTDFDYDGAKLIYTIGAQEFVFKMDDEKRFQREKPHHYSSYFVKVADF